MKLTSLLKNIKSSRSFDLKMWFLPIISITIMVLVGIFVIRVLVLEIISQNNEVTKGEEQLSILIPKLRSLKEQDIETLKNYYMKLDLAIPGQVSPPLILATVEQAATSADLAIESIAYQGLESLSPGDANEITKRGNIRFIFNARGELLQIIAFLKTIQKTNPIILGENLAIGEVKGAAVTKEGEVTVASKEVSLGGFAPFQELPKDLGAITEQLTTLSKDEIKLIESLKDFTTFFEVVTETEKTPFPMGKENPF